MKTNFWSHCYECSNNPNYSGQQYFLKTGDYSDFLKWSSLCNSMRSCHVIPQNSVSHKIQLCEKDELQGQMLELTNYSLPVPGYIRLTEIFFLDVLGGSWILQEMLNFRGQQYLLMPGKYRRFTDWGAMTAKVGFFQPAVHIS
uniref:Crystallin gamma A n=1 Tax=Otus sunia TaxID=257818 RepID=A0A8C8AUY2_9STRI